MASAKDNPGRRKPRRPPATTPEAREKQLITKAVDLAERQLEQGNASAQVITHYLKLASTREILEQEKIKGENELLKARVQALETHGRLEELYTKAISAMKLYSGQGEDLENVPGDQDLQ